LELVTSAAAERNKLPIAGQLAALLPAGAKVLEIASGSGQHVVHFAEQLPGCCWQPTDCSAADFAAIAARTAASALTNIAAPALLDVLEPEWLVAHDFDAVVCINMIHISPWETTPALFAGAARHLHPDRGMLLLYGPFREGGHHTAPSNEAFEGWLKAKDQRFGVRNLEEVDAVAAGAGFERFHLARLPANNLLLAFRRRIPACNPS
jgi:cyclopropane fatty-acyl-phospholipid synthase-like methyltransferase